MGVDSLVPVCVCRNQDTEMAGRGSAKVWPLPLGNWMFAKEVNNPVRSDPAAWGKQTLFEAHGAFYQAMLS